MKPRTVDDVIAALPRATKLWSLLQPEYSFREGPSVGFAVPSMKNHMTDEGWQLFQGLESAGYKLFGKGLEIDNVEVVCNKLNPAIAIVQDKREWQGKTADRSGEIALRNVGYLWARDDIFKGTVLKDAQHDSAYNRQAAEEIGCHFWVHYYHPRIVAHLSPFVRPQHLVRTYHSIDKDLVPELSTKRSGAVLSGAVSAAYPLRQRIRQANPKDVSILPHPGYHRNGCETPNYLRQLSEFKVAICTSSRYGYAVRKIVEATACGCSVITDLPSDEVLPEIDGNLIRIHPDLPMSEIVDVIRVAVRNWNSERQRWYADCAHLYYDYRVLGRKLADDVETLRSSWK